jgi:hypothetical protein
LEVSPAPCSYGANVQSLAVYLLIYQHVPVQRCVQLIADLTGGTGPSDGLVHGMLTRCARTVAGVVTVIKTLITRSPVVGFDETTLRCGQAGQKRYVLSASTENATAYYLGGRDLESFAELGILPALAGIAVHDRYANYFHPRWEHLAGHQACASHLLRDFTDAAQTYPDAHWPPQATRALRGLTSAWHAAREAGLPAIAADARDELVLQFRRAVRVGLSQVPRVPGPRHCTAQRPGRATGVLPRPRTRRPALHHRHPGLAHEQHQRARPTTHQNPTEDLRPPDQPRHHPKPAGHLHLHRHRPQTRHQRHDRHPPSTHRQPLATTQPGTHLTQNLLTSQHTCARASPCPQSRT